MADLCSNRQAFNKQSVSRGLSTIAEILVCVIYHKAMQAGYRGLHREAVAVHYCQPYNCTRQVMHHWLRMSHVVTYCTEYIGL